MLIRQVIKIISGIFAMIRSLLSMNQEIKLSNIIII